MATIRKLPSGKWNVQIRSGGKLVTSSTHASHGLALNWASKEENLLGQKHPLFLDAGYAYCHESLDGKPSQLLALNRIDRICRHRCMQHSMETITLQNVNLFKQARLNTVARTTCRDVLMMIRRVFRWYIMEYHAKTGDMIENPCDLLTMPKPGRPCDRVVTRDELKLLLSAMTPQMAVIVELAYETAMRRGELLKLMPRDLHIEERFLRVVDGKEGSGDVPLTRRAVELLERVLVDKVMLVSRGPIQRHTGCQAGP